jgi:hypothetical protein
VKNSVEILLVLTFVFSFVGAFLLEKVSNQFMVTINMWLSPINITDKLIAFTKVSARFLFGEANGGIGA